MNERRSRTIFGWVAVLAGAGTAGIAYWQPPYDTDAPRWVIYTACAAFVLVGLSLIVPENTHPRINAWLAVGFIAALMVPGAWIALGSGPRACTVSLPFSSGTGSDTLCRGVFGFGALIVAVFLVWAVVNAWRTMRRPGS
jgi:hypothetical protein